jgi:hypothetical protein
MEILSATEKRTGRTGLIFSNEGRRLGQNILNVTIARLGHPCVGHGFRSTFRDWCGDHGVQREIAEAVASAVAAALTRRDACSHHRSGSPKTRRAVWSILRNGFVRLRRYVSRRRAATYLDKILKGLNPEIARMLQRSKLPSPSGAASGGAAADRNHIVAVLPGLIDEIGPALQAALRGPG